MNSLYDIIREKARNNTDAVPPEAWKNILAKRNRPKRALILFFSFIFLGFILSLFFYFSSRQTSLNKSTADNASRPGVTPALEFISKNNNRLPEKDFQLLQKKQSPSNNANTNNLSKFPVKKVSPISGDYFRSSHKNESGTIAAALPGNNPESHSIGVVINDRKRGNPSYNLPLQRKGYSLPSKYLKVKTKYKTTINPGEQTEAEAVALIQDSNKTLAIDQQKFLFNPIGSASENNEIKKSEVTGDTPISLAHDSAAIKIPASLSSGNRNEQQRTTHRSWFFEAAVVPVLPFEKYDHNGNYTRTSILANRKSEFSAQGVNAHLNPAIGASVRAGKNLNSKISVAAGLRYTHFKEYLKIAGEQNHTLYQLTERPVNFNDDTQATYDTLKILLQNNAAYTAINTYTFLTMPMDFQYNLYESHNYYIGVLAGATLNILSKYQNHINSKDQAPFVNTSRFSPYKTGLGFGFSSGLIFRKILNKNFGIFALPSINYCLNKQRIKNSLFDTKIHQASLSLGVTYK